MAQYGEDHTQPRVDEREHLLYGRVSINGGAGGDQEHDGVRMTIPLPFAQLKLMHGSRTIGTTQTRADGSYTMLFTMKAVAKTKKKSKRRYSPEVQLHIINEESDPCKFVNITRRCSFGMELADVTSSDRGVQDGLIWEQSLEISYDDAFPGCAVARTLSARDRPQLLMAKFQDLQAHEFRAAVQELAKEMNEANEDAPPIQKRAFHSFGLLRERATVTAVFKWEHNWNVYEYEEQNSSYCKEESPGRFT